MKKYFVEVKEVHISSRLVEANSVKEALELAENASEIELTYSHTLEPETWEVFEDDSEEENGNEVVIKCENVRDIFGIGEK